MNDVEIDRMIYLSLYSNYHSLKSTHEATNLLRYHEYYLKSNLTKLCKHSKHITTPTKHKKMTYTPSFKGL